MYRRCMRGFLLVAGWVLVLLAALPILAFVHFDDALQMRLMLSKLLLMPVGAACLALAAILNGDRVRH